MEALKYLPSTPNMGSTIPLSCPYQKLLMSEKPDAWRGSETAKPSGKFCIPVKWTLNIQWTENFFISKLTDSDCKIPCGFKCCFWCRTDCTETDTNSKTLCRSNLNKCYVEHCGTIKFKFLPGILWIVTAAISKMIRFQCVTRAWRSFGESCS